MPTWRAISGARDLVLTAPDVEAALLRCIYWDEVRWHQDRVREAERRFDDLRDPFIWAMQGWDLQQASDALWKVHSEGKRPEPDAPWTTGFPRVALMLAGMSLENHLKAVRICSLGWPIDELGFRQIARGSHRLDEIAAQAKVRINRRDRNALRELSHCVRWKGRYPMPKDVDEMKSHVFDCAEGERVLWDEYRGVRVKIDRSVRRALREWDKKLRRAHRKLDGSRG